MEDDIFAALTQEVKEEVVQNYLYERGLIEKQIDNAMELAKHATKLEEKLSRRFYRIYKVLQKSQFIEQFGLNPPATLPEPKSVQQNLNDLADRIYSECRPEIKSMMNDFSCC